MHSEKYRQHLRDIAAVVAKRIYDNVKPGTMRMPDMIGRLMLYNELARTSGAHWDRRIHEELLCLSSDTDLWRPFALGTNGLAGLACAMSLIHRRTGRYENFEQRVLTLLGEGASRVTYDGPPPLWDIRDLLTGAAGILIGFAGRDRALAHKQLTYVLSLSLGNPDHLYTRGSTFLEEPERIYTGMAHGIAGVISALCIACPEEATAVSAFMGWLLSTLDTTQTGFPIYVTPSGEYSVRSSWCLGTPGICIAIVHAAVVLSRRDLLELGVRLLIDVAGDTTVFRFSDNALCHGRAGFGLISEWIGHAASKPQLLALARTVLSEVAEAFDGSSTFGYRATSGNMPPSDNPGFIDGAAGIALALLAGGGVTDFSWSKPLGLGLLESPWTNCG